MEPAGSSSYIYKCSKMAKMYLARYVACQSFHGEICTQNSRCEEPKNYVLLLMHELLIKHLFVTPFNFKVIQFLKMLSLILGKISLKPPSKLPEFCDTNPVGACIWYNYQV